MEVVGAITFCILVIGIVGLISVLQWKKSKRIIKLIEILVLLSFSLLLLLGDEGNRALLIYGKELTYPNNVSVDDKTIQFKEISGDDKNVAHTNHYILSKGKYEIDLSYLAENELNILRVINDDRIIEQASLPKGNENYRYTLDLESDAQNIWIEIEYAGKEKLVIRQLTITPETRFYSDNIFVVVLLWCTFLLILGYKRTPLYKGNQNGLVLIILLLIGIVSTLPMFTSSMLYGDDLCYHLMRIEGLKDGILDGQIPIVIFPNAMSGNGYLNSMYPYMFLLIPACIRMCGVSLILSYKIFILLLNIATIFIMWKCIKCVGESNYAAILGTILYILFPYRYADIYARGAIGEAIALTFFPIIIAGGYHVLFKDRKKWIYLVIGFSGVLQSHILSFMFMVAFTTMCFIIFLRDLLNEKRWIEVLKAAIITVLLNIWFLVPFIYFYRNMELGMGALSWYKYQEYVVNPSYLVASMGVSNFRYISLGLPMVLGIIFCMIFLVYEVKTKGLNDKMDQYFTMLFVTALFAILMVSKFFASDQFVKFSYFNKILEMIQFPWRLLGPIGCVIAFITPIWIEKSNLVEKYELKKQFFIVLVGLALLIFATPMTTMYACEDTRGKDYSQAHEEKIRGIIPSESTIVYPYEWRINGVRDDSLLVTPMASSKSVDIVSYNKNGTDISCDYVANRPSNITFPISNYFGYIAKDEKGRVLQITTANDYAINIELVADGMQHQINIEYVMPHIFILACLASLCTIALILCVNKSKRFNM